jgi:hypothetical protein
MPLLRALRSALAALWSACTSIDLEDCVTVAGYGLLGYGCWLIAPAYGFIVPGALIVVPRVLQSILRGLPQRGEGRRWAA